MPLLDFSGTKILGEDPGTFLNNAGGVLGDLGGAFNEFAKADAYGHNATIDQTQLGETRAMTRLKALREQRVGYQLVGAQHAAIGASGLMESGSALDVLRQSARDIAMDKELIQYQGGIEASNLQEKYRADKSAQSSSFLGGILDIGKAALGVAAL